jgi:hypothetical protein
MGIDDESSHPELCSEVAGGVTRTIVCLFREPDAGNLPVRFDEREQEPEPSQTGLRRRGESQLNYPPGDYSHCACSRLYSRLHSSRGQQVKRLCFVAEPRDCFNLKGDWVVMAHNLDDAGDVEQVGGPFASRTEAEAEAQRLERSP